MSAAEDVIAAVQSGDVERLRSLLAADGTLAAARDHAGVSAIMLARYRFDRAVTDALLAADPELDVFEAATLGYLDRLRRALDEGGDADLATAWSPDGFMAIHLASFYGKGTCLRLLIERGAPVDVYSRNETAVQPLHAAAAGHHQEACRILLAAGADVNAMQRAGWTPLHAAAHAGDVELVELFLSAGADPVRGNDRGETPADTADAAGHVDVATRLREVAAAR